MTVRRSLQPATVLTTALLLCASAPGCFSPGGTPSSHELVGSTGTFEDDPQPAATESGSTLDPVADDEGSSSGGHGDPVDDEAGSTGGEPTEDDGSTGARGDEFEPPATFLEDGFDEGIEDWSYNGEPGYGIYHDLAAGEPTGCLRIEGHTYDSNPAAVRLVALGGWNRDLALVFSLDFRAQSGTAGSTVTNARVRFRDPATGELLHSITLASGGLLDTGWRTYSEDVSAALFAQDAVLVELWMRDAWSNDYEQKAWFDNVELYTE